MRKSFILVLLLVGLISESAPTKDTLNFAEHLVLAIGRYPKTSLSIGALLFGSVCWDNRHQLSQRHALGVALNACIGMYLWHTLIQNGPPISKDVPTTPRSQEQYQASVNSILGKSAKDQHATLVFMMLLGTVQAVVNGHLCYEAMIPKPRKKKAKKTQLTDSKKELHEDCLVGFSNLPGRTDTLSGGIAANTTL